MIVALYIEKITSKDRILELYLNLIEFGDGIYGCEAASQHYFQKSAQDLTVEEAAFLITILPNPKLYTHPSYQFRSNLRKIRILRALHTLQENEKNTPSLPLM